MNMKGKDWKFDGWVPDLDDVDAQLKALDGYFEKPLPIMNQAEATIHAFNSGFYRGCGWHRDRYAFGCEIYTAPYNYNGGDRLDITVKGQDDLGKIFAPTWEMVNGLKNKTITETQYENLYHQRMTQSLRVNGFWWFDTLLKRKQITLVCFCPSGHFCHRYLLSRILVEWFWQLGVKNKGERN